MKNTTVGALLLIASFMLSLFTVNLYKVGEERNKLRKDIEIFRQLNKKALKEKDRELQEIKKKYADKKQVLSQQKEHIKKLFQTVIKLQKKHNDFLKNKEKQTLEKIKSYKAEVQKALDTNKKFASMLSQKREVEVDVNGKKFKLPKQFKEFLAAKKISKYTLI